MVLPLIMVPLLAGCFYALGGGREKEDKLLVAGGINTAIPDAKPESGVPVDKLGIYEMQGRDSSARLDTDGNGFGEMRGRTDPTLEIEQKLKALDREMNRPEQEPGPARTPSQGAAMATPGISEDVDRLEKLMESLRQQKGEDPEMAQLSGMMSDMLDLQYPQRMKERFNVDSKVFRDSVFRAIPARIVERTKVASGGVLKLELLDSAWVADVMLPKGQLLFGLCQLSNQRLLLDIKTVRIGTSIVPVDLSVYSLDGIRGIAAPEAIVEDAAGMGADNAVRRMDVLGMENSIGMQAAGAGVMAAKSLLSKKIRTVKVRLSAGQRVLLRDNLRKSK